MASPLLQAWLAAPENPGEQWLGLREALCKDVCVRTHACACM